LQARQEVADLIHKYRATLVQPQDKVWLSKWRWIYDIIQDGKTAIGGSHGDPALYSWLVYQRIKLNVASIETEYISSL